jgi:hypothetical protein
MTMSLNCGTTHPRLTAYSANYSSSHIAPSTTTMILGCFQMAIQSLLLCCLGRNAELTLVSSGISKIFSGLLLLCFTAP